MAATLASHQHGKSKVRLARVWREGGTHYLVEWSVDIMLESAMEHAFLKGTNTDMTATDTQKNTVYYVAKQCRERCSPEEYALALARHFVREYPKVSKAKIGIKQKPWKRVQVGGQDHAHGFAVTGTETRTCYVTFDKQGQAEFQAGVSDLSVAKTTQSGYEGYLHDRFTLLKETRERMMATTVTSTWKYSRPPQNWDAAYEAVRSGILEGFFGHAQRGVYSPSVQFTLFEMAKLILAKVPAIDSVFFNLPNLHFLPCTPVTSKFEDDVYVATSEPHGNIEAVVTRAQVQPHAKL